MAQLPSRAIKKKIEWYDICDVAQSSSADISGIMSDSLRVALVKLRVCSNSDSSNSLLPRSHLSLNLPPFYPRTALIVTLIPPSLSFSLSHSLFRAYRCAPSSRLFSSTRCGSVVQSIMYTLDAPHMHILRIRARDAAPRKEKKNKKERKYTIAIRARVAREIRSKDVS